jgi:hypothetical protein
VVEERLREVEGETLEVEGTPAEGKTLEVRLGEELLEAVEEEGDLEGEEAEIINNNL